MHRNVIHFAAIHPHVSLEPCGVLRKVDGWIGCLLDGADLQSVVV